MARKSYLLLICLIILGVAMFGFVGCSNSAPAEPAEQEGEEPQEEPQAQEKVVLKLGHGIDENNSWAIMCTKFKEIAEAEGNGNIEVQIFPNSQLGDDVEQVRSVQTGAQEIAAPAISNFNPSVSQLGYFLLPYAFETKEQARTVIEKMWDQNNEWAIDEAGVRILGYLEGGFRVLSNSKKPVKTIDDLKGLRIRVPPNKIMIGAYQSWGIEPITVPWSETFSALQQGVVDGQDNPYVTINSMKFYEVQKYITEIDYIYNVGVVIINEKYFQGLPEDIQNILVAAGKEMTEFGYQLNDEGVEGDKKALEEKGMELFGRPEDMDEWIKRGKSIWPEYYEMIGGGDAEKGKQVIDILESQK